MKIFVPAVLIFASLAGYSQTSKIFFGPRGPITDSAKARLYLIVNRVSDTVWNVKQYDMDNVLNYSGTYKDKELTVQNGHFIYYALGSIAMLKPGTKVMEIGPGVFQYVQATGDYINGMKNGEWVEYRSNGNRMTVNTYKNDFQNGLYEKYDDESGKVLFRGNYVNDKREGDWYMLDGHGNISVTFKYKDGKVTKRIDAPPNYGLAKPTRGFIVYISNNLNRISRPEMNANLSVICSIEADGKLSKPSIYGPGLTDKLNDKLNDIISGAPAWTPLYDPVDKKNFAGLATFSIIIEKGSVDVRYE